MKIKRILYIFNDWIDTQPDKIFIGPYHLISNPSFIEMIYHITTLMLIYLSLIQLSIIKERIKVITDNKGKILIWFISSYIRAPYPQVWLTSRYIAILLQCTLTWGSECLFRSPPESFPAQRRWSVLTSFF